MQSSSHTKRNELNRELLQILEPGKDVLRMVFEATNHALLANLVEADAGGLKLCTVLPVR